MVRKVPETTSSLVDLFNPSRGHQDLPLATDSQSSVRLESLETVEILKAVIIYRVNYEFVALLFQNII